MKQHLTPQLLEQLQSNQPIAAEAMQRLLQHLSDLCPDCRSVLANAQQKKLAEQHSHLEEVFDFALTRTVDVSSWVEKQKNSADRDCNELLGLASSVREARIDRAIKRFRNPFLVDLLIEESRARLNSAPSSALDLAECAYQVALRLPHNVMGDTWAMTCVARANAYRGNALRVLGELKAAQMPLEMALSLFQEKGDADPLVEAELLSLLASLHKDRLHLEEAEAVLERALFLARAFGTAARIGRILIQLAIVFDDSDRLQEAIATAQEALSMLDPEEHAQLYFAAQHNLTHYLEAAGRIEEANELLHSNLERYKFAGEPATRSRFLWNWGRIAFGLGQFETARTTLENARAGFSQQGREYDAALVGLDIALVLIQMNQIDALIQIATEILPVFEAQEMERDTIAAFLLFREAVHKREISSQLVSQLMTQLQRTPQPATEKADALA